MADDLQFDRAESKDSPPSVACAGCKRPLVGEYYLAGGAKICADCKAGVHQYLDSGSKGGRVAKAALLGGLAALAGGALWAVFIVTTNSMWGFIAIGLGYLVGIAVRKGSEGRGGRAYQALALGLVYFGIATGYMGVIVSQWDTKKKPPAATETKADATADPVKPEKGGGLADVVMFFMLYVSAPILIGKADPFSLLFLGIALWEAWRLNSGANLQVSGPYKLGG